MYGYPGQTTQETVDSLETVRQLFANRCIDSAYWHKFTLTCHSRVFSNPDKFGIIVNEHDHDFCRNDIEFSEINGTNHDQFTVPLNTALYNYMNMQELDRPVRSWFYGKTPSPSVSKDLIAKSLNSSSKTEYSSIFIARKPEFIFKSSYATLIFVKYADRYEISVSKKIGTAIKEFYNNYRLYTEIEFNKAILILASILGTDSTNIFF